MKSLTLNLDDGLASRFNNLTAEEKNRVEKLLGAVLEELFRQKQNESLADTMNKMAEQAEKNGLTISKLAELMEWDEETVRTLFDEQAIRDGH